MGGARVFRNWNAGSGVVQTKSGKVPVVLEMCQLVPDVFGNVRQVSVFSRCFSSWSAGSGRFRKISEGFDVIPLFSKLVSWFRKISETIRKVSTLSRCVFELVCGVRLLKAGFNVIPLFSSWSTVLSC